MQGTGEIIDLYILDTTFKPVGVLDYYTSLNWHKNMLGEGEVEIEIPITGDTDLSYIQRDHFITRKDDDMIAIITYTETREQSDSVPIYYVKATDTTIFILNKRIVWSNFIFQGTVTAFINKLINENFSSPSIENRKILASDGTPLIRTNFVGTAGSELMNYQTNNDQIGDLITTILATFGYGMLMTISRTSGTGVVHLILNVYRPSNRSSYVIFNTKFDNVINTNFTAEYTAGTNVILVGGEKDSGTRRYQSVGRIVSGLERSETFLDAKDLSRNISWSDLITQYPPKEAIYDFPTDPDNGGYMEERKEPNKSGVSVSGEQVQFEDAADGESLIVGEIFLPYDDDGYTEALITSQTDYWTIDRLIKKGCRGEDVMEVQRRLINKGYSCGKWGVDGIFGSATYAAVVAFQMDYWPDVPKEWDGIVGPKTGRALGAGNPVGDTVYFPEKIYGGTLDFVNGKLYSQYTADGEEKELYDIYDVTPLDIKSHSGTNILYCTAEGSKITVKYCNMISKWDYIMGVFKIPIQDMDQLDQLRAIYKNYKWSTQQDPTSGITYFCVQDAEIAVFDVNIIKNPPDKDENGNYKENPTAYAKDALYTAMIITKGYEAYQEASVDTSFSAEIDPNVTFKYKEDYILGDYVGIYNNYGIKAAVQITDITETIDPSGYHFDVTLSNASSKGKQEVIIYCGTDAVETVYLLTDDGQYICL